jgi:glutathione synthase
MNLSIAIQMDPVESINIESDSSFSLGLEAQARGYALYCYQPQDLSSHNGNIKASLREVIFRREQGNHFTLGKEIISSFNEIDIILMRQDPPFDMNYLTYTYLLERLPKSVMVINNPLEVRNCPEKLFVLNFSQFMAPTLVTANFEEAEKFFHEHKDIIIKPLYAHGGADINRVNSLATLPDTFGSLLDKYKAPVMVQKFLPEVANGDKRIIFIDGKVAGAINRIPPKGEILSNTARGGSANATELTKRDLEICAAVGPELRKRGLLLAGIDVIDGYISEINVTSPTGMQFIDRIYGTNLAAIFWDCVEGYKERKPV